MAGFCNLTKGEAELVARAFSGRTGEAIKKALRFRVNFNKEEAMRADDERVWRDMKAAVKEIDWVSRLGVRAGQEAIMQKDSE